MPSFFIVCVIARSSWLVVPALSAGEEDPVGVAEPQAAHATTATSKTAIALRRLRHFWETGLFGFTRWGWFHFSRTSSQCQRRSVSDVTGDGVRSHTGRSRCSTASTMRSSGLSVGGSPDGKG